jgi:hypothetical protein
MEFKTDKHIYNGPIDLVGWGVGFMRCWNICMIGEDENRRKEISRISTINLHLHSGATTQNQHPQ